MNIVPIAFAFDDNMVMPACVCISSLMMNAKNDTFYDIFILHSAGKEPGREKLDLFPEHYPNCCINYRAVDNTFDGAFEIRGITTPAYYRLMIPDLIPEYDKVIYSDVDVVFRSDLSELYFGTDLTGCYVAGVNSLACLNPDYDRYYRGIGLEPDNIIYSGNLVFNSRKMREDGIVARFKEHSGRKYKFQDMDILNIVCRGKIKYMGPAFCVSTFFSQWAIYGRGQLERYWSGGEIDLALKNGIVHYNGQKPWKGYCVNFDIWREYYRKSQFFDGKFYFDFFYGKLDELDRLSLLKRVKILVRYFVYGRKG